MVGKSNAQRRKRGQIIPRGDRKFLLRVYLGRVSRAKRRYSSKTFVGTRRQAEKELTAMLRDLDTQTYVEPSKQRIDDYLKKWLDSKQNIGPKTRRDYSHLIEKHIIPKLGALKLHEVTGQRVQMCYQTLSEQGLSPRTVQYVHAVLRQTFEQACRWNLLLRNPCEYVTLPKRSRGEGKILTRKQVVKLLESTKGDLLHPLWMLLLTSGLRPQEALALKWGDLDGNWLTVQRALVEVKKGKYEVGATKTNKSRRTIALPDTTVEALKAHRRETGRLHGLIFTNAAGNPLDLSSVRKAWKAALKKYKLPQVRLYDTRHTHISHLLAGGVDLKFASERAGHSSIRLTADTYAHVLPESEKKIAGVVENLYFDKDREAKGGSGLSG